MKHEAGLTLTLNQMGYMFDVLTEYDEAFIQYSAESKVRVLDIGAAYGVVTLKVLEQNTPVVANDLEKKHLEILLNKVPEDQKSLITTIAGKFPQEIDFETASFRAIHSSNVLHFLTPTEIESAIIKIHSWLKPGGKVFIIAATPYVRIWQEFIPLFEKRLENKERWPGFVNELSIFKTNTRKSHMPDFMHFFDPVALSKVFNEAGFIVEKSGFCSRTDWPYDMQLDGRESMALIARKPL